MRGLLAFYLKGAILLLLIVTFVLHIAVVSQFADNMGATFHLVTNSSITQGEKSSSAKFNKRESNDTRQILSLKKSPCQDMDNHNATTTSKPVWVAGYPGSGNDLLRTLVQHISGFEGRDVYLDVHCAVGRTATCKTHWPVFRRHPPLEVPNEFHESAILLIRNPAKALPSYFNYEWEYHHNITDHSQQAPEGAWIEWRDANFGKQIRVWKRLVTWWFQHWHVQTVVPYEQLIHEQTGPVILRQLAAHMQVANFPVATDLHCQWQWCVQQAATVKRSGHQYTPPFQQHQKDAILKIVNQTLVLFSNHSVLAHVLVEYLLDIEQNTRVVS